jgi:hypothetical protein
MKISEMEYHHGEYTSLEGKINTMLGNREFPAIFSVCVESFPHVVPAIQYRKKREIEPEMPDWLAFKVICKYAPPLFEHSIMESLSEFVKSTRLLAKHENGYLKAIDSALELESNAQSIWSQIERQQGISLQALENEYTDFSSKMIDIEDIAQSIWKQIKQHKYFNQNSYNEHKDFPNMMVYIINLWEQLGIISRKQEINNSRIYFRSRLNEDVEGVCLNCGVHAKGHKELFFKPIVCQKCGIEGYYHIRYPNTQE